MSDNDDTDSHPSTIKAQDTHREGIDWNDHATLHLKHDGQGLFDALKGIQRGTLAQLVTMVSNMPADERSKYVIQKAGDHQLGTSEIMALAAREDFPG